MFGSVFLHVLAHAFIEQLAILWQLHVDKIHNDDAAHVPEAQLASQLVGGSQVGFKGVGLLIVLLLNACSTVHIHHMHRLCVFDDEVGAVLVIDSLSKARLQLFGDTEVVKDRHCTIIQTDYLFFLWSNEPQVVLDFVVDTAVVDVDAVVRGIEQISK